MTVSPVWGHSHEKHLANVCMLNNMYKSNRERLYMDVCKAVLKSTSTNLLDQSNASQRIPFRVVNIPGDGRCAWRTILAAQDLENFEKVTRRGFICIYIYKSQHILSCEQRPWFTLENTLYSQRSTKVECTICMHIW